MHLAAQRFFHIVKDLLPDYFEKVSVLDFGSFDVNGSLRPMFTNSTYIGVDLIAGPSVDVIGDCATIFINQEFDVGLSSECFEHNPHWKETFLNLVKHTKSDGLVLFSCAAPGRPEHGTARTNPSESPGTNAKGWDYYKNLGLTDFEPIVHAMGNVEFSEFWLHENYIAHDLYFIGFRRNFPKSPDVQAEIVHSIEEAVKR